MIFGPPIPTKQIALTNRNPNANHLSCATIVNAEVDLLLSPEIVKTTSANVSQKKLQLKISKKILIMSHCEVL